MFCKEFNMICIKQKGNFSKTEKFLKKSFGKDYLYILEKYGKLGVANLSDATPVDTGLTASSWKYEIIQNDGNISIVWSNTNVQNYVNIAIILQYGHATAYGGYVEGIDYINPALKPIFQQMADSAWREVTRT